MSRFPLIFLAMVAAAAAGVADARGENYIDQTTEAAVLLMRRAVTPPRRGYDHLVLISSLRQLEDPDLSPMFKRLMDSKDRAMQINGLLGLAECNGHKLDLKLLAEIKEPILQSDVISAAIENDLLDTDSVAQIMKWENLDSSVKIVLATQLVRVKRFTDTAFLKTAAKAEGLPPRSLLSRRGIAGMLLTQLNDPAGPELLKELDASTDERLDDLREVLLQMVLRFEFDRLAPWALKIAQEPSISLELRQLALRASMRLNAAGATAVWRQRYDAETNPLVKIEWVLMALATSSAMNAEPYQVLAESKDEFIRQVGLTGKAVVARKDAAAAVISLAKMGHPFANAWALIYAKDQANDQDSLEILRYFIHAPLDAKAKEEGKEKEDAKARLDECISATQIMLDRHPEAAVELIRPYLASKDTQLNYYQALLWGLVRARDPAKAGKVLEGIDSDLTADLKIKGLVLFVKAKAGAKLSDLDLDYLGVLARGGAGFSDSLRIQAGWIFLKRFNLAKAALDKALAS